MSSLSPLSSPIPNGFTVEDLEWIPPKQPARLRYLKVWETVWHKIVHQTIVEFFYTKTSVL